MTYQYSSPHEKGCMKMKWTWPLQHHQQRRGLFGREMQGRRNSKNSKMENTVGKLPREGSFLGQWHVKLAFPPKQKSLVSPSWGRGWGINLVSKMEILCVIHTPDSSTSSSSHALANQPQNFLGDGGRTSGTKSSNSEPGEALKSQPSLQPGETRAVNSSMPWFLWRHFF